MSDPIDKLENVINYADCFNKLEQAIKSLRIENKEQMQQLEQSIQTKVEQSAMSPKNESKNKPTPLVQTVQTRKTIKFSFTRKEFCNKYFMMASPAEEVAGKSWDVYVISDATRKDDVSIYLRSFFEDEAGFCDTSFKISFYAEDQVYSKEFTYRFRKTHMKFDQCGYDGILTWDQFSDLNNDETLTAEVDLKIYGSSDADQPPGVLDKFCSSTSFPSDCVLLIDGKKIHVSKGLLFVHSQFFNKLFNGDFAEKNDSEIAIEDLDAAEFCQLLQAIYPSMQETISPLNVGCILKLAERFAMDVLLNRCEQFLISAPAAAVSITYANKMLIAQEYRLQNLMGTCIAQYKSVDSLKNLMEEPEYAAYSDKTMRILLENLLGKSDKRL